MTLEPSVIGLYLVLSDGIQQLFQTQRKPSVCTPHLYDYKTSHYGMIKTIQQRSPLYYTCSCVAFNIGSWMSVYILCNALKPPGKLCSWREKQNDWGEIGVLSALK